MSLNFNNSNTELSILQNTNKYIDITDLNNIYSVITNDISNNINVLTNELTNYTNKQNNYDKLLQLYPYYSKTNNNIIQQNNIINDNTNTNNRKSFYEAQEYDNLILWYVRFFWFYYIVAIMLVLILFLSKNEITLYVKIAMTIGLILYPLIIDYILKPFLILYAFIYNLIPKNVYNTL